MKLSNVIILSIIGMLVTSLSVLVFTTPRQVSPDDLTSNELAIEHKPSPTTKLNLILEPDTVASIVTPQTTPPGQTAPSAAYDDDEKFGTLQLTTEDEPCSFSIDGKSVSVESSLPMTVKVGTHKVKCERPNGDIIETQVDIAEGVLSPVSF